METKKINGRYRVADDTRRMAAPRQFVAPYGNTPAVPNYGPSASYAPATDHQTRPAEARK